MAIKLHEEPIDTWSEFLRVATTSFSGKWLFRGGLDSWSLVSSLERAAREWDAPLSELPDLERRLLREFKRAYPVRAEIQRAVTAASSSRTSSSVRPVRFSM